MRSCERRCHAPRRGFTLRGFTLVEILVVLAIIGILAAILLPVFNSVRETARTVTCSSNLKQIYLGTRLYTQDSAGTYPNASFGGGAYKGLTNCGWASLIYPYARSTEVFECPNAEYGEFRDGCPADSPDNPEQPESKSLWDGSYDFNILRVGTREYIRESLVGQPSEAMLFSDGSGGLLSPYGRAFRTEPGSNFDNRYEWAVYDMRNLALSERGHGEGLNICFADGHVKRLDADRLAHRALWLNTRDAEYNLRAP